MMLNYVDPNEMYLRFLAAHLRQADIDELNLLRQIDPLTALYESVNKSDFSSVVLDGLEPIAIFGVGGDALGPDWSLWLVGTDKLNRIGKTFLSNARAFIAQLIEENPDKSLWNYVSRRNHKAVRF